MGTALTVGAYLAQLVFPLMFRLQEPLADREQQLLADLRHWMASQSSLCVAYSGGVDSTLVAAMAYEAKGDTALAVTGVRQQLLLSIGQRLLQPKHQRRKPV